MEPESTRFTPKGNSSALGFTARIVSDAVLGEKIIIELGFGYHGSHVLDTFDWWWAGWCVLPEITVPKDFFNDVLFFNKTYDLHCAPAHFGQAQCIAWDISGDQHFGRLSASLHKPP